MTITAEYYTRKSLALECGVDVKTIDRHIKAGTAKLNRAAERVPGLGVMIDARLAARFIAMMKAKTAGRQSQTAPRSSSPTGETSNSVNLP